jgi:hypothetical protein
MRTRETTKVFLPGFLTAAHTHGYQPEKRLQEPTAKVLQNDNLVYAIYPSIVGEAYVKTMDNYRKYVSEYNFRTTQENELVEKHNAIVRIYKKNNQLSDLEKEYIKFFPLKCKGFNDRQFNQTVDEAGEHSKLILKRRINTIKPVTEQFFSNFLNVYNGQLMSRNTHYMNLGVKNIRPIQKLDINSQHVKNLKRNGIASIAVCSKTIRSHRTRLQEAEILTDYSFHGRYTGVKVHINAQILTVFDIQTNKIVIAENQRVSLEKGNVLPDLYVTTQTFKQEYKKRDDATQSSCDKELPKATAPLHYKNVFYKNTGGNVENFTEGGAPKNVKVSQTKSDKLQALIQHPQELAENLATGMYDNYIPIDIRDLRDEAYGGTMLKEEFRELYLQDFIKSMAKLYRGSNVYAGTWKNAINVLMDNYFVNFKGLAFQKHNVFDDIEEMRWRLENARKWFAGKKINPLYPSNYLDPTRKSKKEVGFEYTKVFWSKHKKYREIQKPQRELKRRQNAEKRGKQINHSQKFNKALQDFLAGKKELPQLIDYVQNNLPQEFYAKMREKLEFLQTKYKA